ncbi:MAG TPA: hypothetical protein VM764_01120 [Gemmatimonadaceae bacterium]|nr:hypothetical protein [Gemmatimonadaceae bacterium]
MRMPEQPASSLSLSRQVTPEARGAELEAFSRAVEREAFWDAVRTISACFSWCIIGVAGMSWSVASTDGRWAPVVFWGALAVCNTGILFALHGAMRRSVRRNGEW